MELLSSVLFSLYRGSAQHGEWVMACLEGTWSRIVGERIAQICRPLKVKDDHLVLEILDPAWEQTLKGLKGELLERVREATSSEVRRLSFSARRQ